MPKKPKKGQQGATHSVPQKTQPTVKISRKAPPKPKPGDQGATH